MSPEATHMHSRLHNHLGGHDWAQLLRCCHHSGAGAGSSHACYCRAPWPRRQRRCPAARGSAAGTTGHTAAQLLLLPGVPARSTAVDCVKSLAQQAQRRLFSCHGAQRTQRDGGGIPPRRRRRAPPLQEGQQAAVVRLRICNGSQVQL